MRIHLTWMAAAALLAGCGGGIYLGFDDDDPPSVNLAAASTSAAPGQAVRLAATASDDDYVIEVDFYRVETNGSSTFLGYDAGPPYDFDALVPTNAVRGSTVSFFARAVDSSGQRSDSVAVGVLVQ